MNPQIANGPKQLNELLEDVYNKCIKSGKSKSICSASAWSAAHSAGWYKGDDNKWHKKSFSEMVDIIEKRQAAITQTILLSKERFKTKEEAANWLKTHNKKYDNIRETDENWRAEQRDPGDFKESSFRIHEIDEGVKIIIGRLKKEG